MAWIENHYDACRNYFADDPYFVEIDIEAADAPDRLGKALGIPIVGWGDFKPEQAGTDQSCTLIRPAKRAPA